jgi:hypothetical protein
MMLPSFIIDFTESERPFSTQLVFDGSFASITFGCLNTTQLLRPMPHE